MSTTIRLSDAAAVAWQRLMHSHQLPPPCLEQVPAALGLLNEALRWRTTEAMVGSAVAQFFDVEEDEYETALREELTLLLPSLQEATA